MAIPYVSTPTSLTLIVNYRPTVIPSSHPNFKELLRLAKLPDTIERDIVGLLDIPQAITDYTGGEITIVGGRLFYRGSEVKNNLATIILGFVKSNDPTAAEPFKKFLSNCRQNPDLALIDTIYDWCVKGNLPITPDGELLAWKIVDRNYMSKYSGKRGKLDHGIGKTVTEPREECNPNRNQTCSTGIHFASVEYIEKGSYGSIDNGDRIVAVVINPANITAIPTDYNLSKGRCCELRVVGEIQRQDQLGGFYGSAKVYSGWEAPKPAPARVRDVQLPLRNGDVVELRNGNIVTVSGDSDVVVGYDDNGRSIFYRSSGRCLTSGEDCQRDVIDTITRAPAKPKTPRNASGIAKGQVWAKRNGSQVTIASTIASGGYPVKDDQGSVYTSTGRFNSDHSVSQLDLVRLVKDVD